MGITIIREDIRPGIVPKNPVHIDLALESVRIFFSDPSTSLRTLEDILSDNYIYSRIVNSKGTYDEYKVQPFLEVLFIHDPKNFLFVFNKAKENSLHLASFLLALAKTDLNVLNKPWDADVMLKILRGYEALDLHYRTLSQTGASVDANNLSELMDQLGKIIPLRGGRGSEEKFLNEPNLLQKIEFAATLHSRDSQMLNHRAHWKVIAGNLLLGLLGAGILYGIAVLLNNGNTFFGKTDRQKKIDDLHIAIDPELPRKAF